MNEMTRDLDQLEASSYGISARRAVVASRPPRRESPRFLKKRTGSGMNGAHRRCNKRNGL